jgi:hypothetical protein
MATTIYSFESHNSASFRGPQLKTESCGNDKFIHTITETLCNGTGKTLQASYFVTESINPEEELNRRGSPNKHIEAIYIRDNKNVDDGNNVMKAFIRYLNRKYSKVTFVINASTLSDKVPLKQLFKSEEFQKDFVNTRLIDGELIINPVPPPKSIPFPERRKKRTIITSDDESDEQPKERKLTKTDNNGNKKLLSITDDGNKENIQPNVQTNTSSKPSKEEPFDTSQDDEDIPVSVLVKKIEV